jgi:hypothetical protein
MPYFFPLSTVALALARSISMSISWTEEPWFLEPSAVSNRKSKGYVIFGWQDDIHQRLNWLTLLVSLGLTD